MFIHLVLFKFAEVNEKEIDKVFNEIRALKHECKGIIGFRTGKNFSEYGHGYTHGLVVSFQKQEDLEEYMNNSTHTKILDKLESITKDILAVDFEDHC